jgi:hypothetical protein
MGMTFKKQIFPLGKHFVSDSKGNRREIEITEDRALAWINKFNNMRSQGLRVTAPWEHDVDARPVTDLLNAKNNGGEWKSLYLEDGMVVGHLEAATEEDEKNIGTKVDGCSIFVDDFVDGSGKEWNDSILHICLTNHPVSVTEGYEPSQNSLSIAMSTVMKNEEAGMSLNELATTLKAKLGIDLPAQETGINEYLKMLIAVFKNYNNDFATDGMQTVSPGMDIYMSTKPPEDGSSSAPAPVADTENWQQKYADMKKRVQGFQKREKALLDHISSSVVGNLAGRITSLKEKYSEKENNQPMMKKISDLEASIGDAEFEFDFKQSSLMKTHVENQIEMMELFSDQEVSPAPEKEKLTKVEPPEEVPADLDSFSNEETQQVVNSF